jgi:hypothetical protein
MTKAREIKYPKGNIELKEYANGDWSKTHYNQYGDPIKYETKERVIFTAKYTYDENGKELTYEDTLKSFRFDGLYVTEEQFHFKIRKITKARYLCVTSFPYIEKDKNGNITYKEEENGIWTENTYDSKGRQLNSISSHGLSWSEFYYDRFGRGIAIKSNSPVFNEETTYKNNTKESESARVLYSSNIHIVNKNRVSEAKYFDFIEEVNCSNMDLKPTTFEVKSKEYLKSNDYVVFKIPKFLIKFYNIFFTKSYY